MKSPDSSANHLCPWCGGEAYADAFIGGMFASADPEKWPSHITLDDGASKLSCQVWCAGCGATGPNFETGLVLSIEEAEPQIKRARDAWNRVASRSVIQASASENVLPFKG